MRAVVRSAAVVGRSAELTLLTEAIACLQAGCTARGAVFVVTGEAGIGKSRLAREAADAAACRGLPVVWGRASAGLPAVPMRPVTELVTAGFAALDPRADTRRLDPYRPALARLVPVAGAPPSPEATAVVLAEGVRQLLAALRGVAIVEDLQWADAGTMAVVEYLADHAQADPVVLVLTVRTDEDAPFAAVARGLAQRGAATLLDLRRLDQAEAGAMAAACLGVAGAPPEPARELLDAAEGLPLLIEDLLSAAIGEGSLVRSGSTWTAARDLVPGISPTFGDTVQRRLAGLDDRVVAVLRAAALLGPGFDWRLLPAITGQDPEAVLAALRGGIACGLIVADAVGFAFRHALTAAAVAARMLPPERARMCRRAADAVRASTPAGEPDDEACLLAARLLAAAGDQQAAADLMLLAGRRALAAGLVSSAVALLDRAAELSPSAETGLALLEAVSAAGDAARTREVGAATLALLPGGPPLMHAHLLQARGLMGSRPQDADRELTAARVAAAGDPVLLARVDALAALVMLQSSRADRIDRARSLAARAVTAAEASGLHEVACEALEVIGRCARVTDLDAAEAAFARQLQIAKLGQLELWRLRAQNELGTIAWLRRCDPSGVQAAHDAALAAGAVLLATGYAVDLAVFHTLLGEYPRALAIAGECARLARRLGADGLLHSAVLAQAMVAAHQARRDDMEALLTQLGDTAAGDLAVAEWGLCRAMAALAEEDRQAALAAFARAEQEMRTLPALMGDAFSGVSVVVRLADGTADAADLAAIDRHAPGTILHVLTGALARAIVAGRDGRPREAAAFIEEAKTVRNAGLYRHLLFRYTAEAALADGWGDPAAWLVEAQAWFASHGLERPEAACRRLLRAAGVPVGRSGRAEVTVAPALRRLGVTAREGEVLTLLGYQLTNRAIGDRLFLSPRTVEKHVASLRRKLGASSRDDVPAAARRLANG
jgi:DNA-binding CsgD family transcriptional regulator